MPFRLTLTLTSGKYRLGRVAQSCRHRETHHLITRSAQGLGSSQLSLGEGGQFILPLFAGGLLLIAVMLFMCRSHVPSLLAAVGPPVGARTTVAFRPPPPCIRRLLSLPQSLFLSLTPSPG